MSSAAPAGSTRFGDTIAASATPEKPSGYRYDVFLCHNRLEKPLIMDVADTLQVEKGILFFLDEYSIPASVEFMDFIESEMRRSASCAIFLGPAGWGPTHSEEAKLALKIYCEAPGFRIIPVLLPGADEGRWSEVFGLKGPPFNWVRFQSLTDAGDRAKLVEAIQGKFVPKTGGPEIVTPYFIRRQAALWEASGRRDGSLLFRGQLLIVAQAVAAADPVFVGPNAAPFLVKSAQAERERYRTRLVLAVTAAVIAVFLSVLAWWQRSKAIRAADLALVRSLAATAPRSIGVDRLDERAALLARQSYLIDDSWGAPSEGIVTASLREVLETPYFSSSYQLSDGKVANEISASGAFLLTGNNSQQVIGPIIGPNGDQRHPKQGLLPKDVVAATFDPKDDAVWVCSDTGELRLHSAADLKNVTRRFPNFVPTAKTLAVSADGLHVAAISGDHTLTWLDVATSKSIKWVFPKQVSSIALSPHGDSLAVGTEGEKKSLALVRVGSTKPFAIYPGEDDVNAFAFDPSGRGLLIGERGGKAWRWIPGEKGRGNRISLGPDSNGSVDVLAASADGGKLAAASGSITPGIQLWRQVDSKSPPDVIPGQRTVAALRFTIDGTFLISSSTSGEVRYWRLAGTGVTRKLRADAYQQLPLSGRLYSVVRNPKTGEFLVGGDHGVLQAWRSGFMGSPRILAPLRETALRQAPDLQSYVAGNGRNYLLTGHVLSMAVSGDGSRIATVDPYGFAVVLPATGSTPSPQLIISQSSSHAAFSVALSASGRRLAIGATSTLTILHDLAENGAPLTNVPIASPGDSTVRALVFEDEDHLVVGDDAGRVRRWTLSPQLTSEDLTTSGPGVNAFVALKNGDLAVARGEQVDIFPRRAPKSTRTVTSGLGWATSLAVSDDGSALAVGFGDGSIRIWSMSNLEREPTLLNGQADVIRSLAFDSTGELLVSVADDGTINGSMIGRHRLAALVCQLTWRDLDQHEIQAYFGDAAPRSPTCASAREAAN